MSNTEIAKYVIGYVYDVSPEIVKIIDRNDFIIANYLNKNGELIDNKVKFVNDVAIWGALKGRWRTHKKDSVIRYSITDGYIKISEEHYQNPNINFKEYKL